MHTKYRQAHQSGAKKKSEAKESRMVKTYNKNAKHQMEIQFPSWDGEIGIENILFVFAYSQSVGARKCVR